jgi:tetratricopeptide (TPR) repeat protein
MIKSLVYKFVYLTVALLMLAVAAPSTSAQKAQRNMQKEAAIWKELAYISPSSVETFKRATEAMDKGDTMEAIRRYGEVMLEAPEWDVVNRRLGLSLMETGQIKEGMAQLRKAVELKRSPENLISLAQMTAYPGPDIQTSAKDKEQALLLAKEAYAKRTDQDDVSYPFTVAQLAFELNNLPDFRMATQELSNRHQDFMGTHFFKAVLAEADNDLSTAKQEIERAGQMGLPAEDVEKFLANSGIRTREAAWRYAYIAGFVILAWALGLVLLFVLGGILSKGTLKELETADPETLVSPEHDKLRSVYRKVINIAGLY